MQPTTFISGIVIALTIHSANAQTSKKNDLYDWGLVGNVKSVHETWYEAKSKSGQITKGKKIINENEKDAKLTFNNSGYMVEELRYDMSGNLAIKYTCAYDDKMNRTEECRFGPDGNLARTVKFILVYDSSGNNIETNILNEQGDVNGRTIRKYDAKGNIIERQRLYANGISKMKLVYNYDDNGNVIEIDSYDSNGNIIFKNLEKVNENGKVIERLSLEGGTKFYSKYTFAYDHFNNKIELIWFKKEGKPYENWMYKYEYDSYNNWTQRIQYKGKKAISITERKIEYY